MPPNQADGEMPRVSVSVPNNQKTALDYVATEQSEPGNRTYVSEVVRDAIAEYLGRHYDELPGEARDLLDDDLRANAGDGALVIDTDDVEVDA